MLKNICLVTKTRHVLHGTLLQQALCALHDLPSSDSRGYLLCEILRAGTMGICTWLRQPDVK